MEIIEGATATFTVFHCSLGLVVIICSMASFRISIPVDRVTCSAPRYIARSTFFGSSIGVGKDWAVKINRKFVNTLKSRHKLDQNWFQNWREPERFNNFLWSWSWNEWCVIRIIFFAISPGILPFMRIFVKSVVIYLNNNTCLLNHQTLFRNIYVSDI